MCGVCWFVGGVCCLLFVRGVVCCLCLLFVVFVVFVLFVVVVFGFVVVVFVSAVNEMSMATRSEDELATCSASH